MLLNGSCFLGPSRVSSGTFTGQFIRRLRSILKGVPCFGLVFTLIHPHLLGRFVSNHNFSLRNLISHEEVFVFNVLGSFATGAPSIYFQEDAALVVLIDESMGHIVTLFLNKVEAPENLLHGVVYTHQLGLSGALSIKLLFPGAANDGPLPEGHACPSLSFAVPVYSMGRIDEPDYE